MCKLTQERLEMDIRRHRAHRALHALADLLSPVVKGCDLHLVNREDLHNLVRLVADEIERNTPVIVYE